MPNAKTLTAALAITALMGMPALAAEGTAADGGVTIELNKLEPVEGACRVYMLLNNGTGQKFDDFNLDLYVFRKDGVIDKRLAIQAAPLLPDKTRVRLFDITDLDCGEVGRMLINGFLGCTAADGQAPGECSELISLSSRVEGVPIDK